MDINSILEPLDNLLKSIDTNKNLLFFVLVLLGIYFIYISNSNSNILKNSIYLFDNEIFKFALFMIITFVSSSSPAIGVALALIMFVSLQIITYTKLKKELDNELENSIISETESEEVEKEKFSSMAPVDMAYLNDEYLVNPLEKTSQLAPPINFNLKPITPKELSYQMISKGKSLLNDSFDLEQDLKTRYDTREKQITFETQKNGSELVDSGINRLQMADQGEYNTKSNKIKVSKYCKLMNKNNLTNLSNLSNLSNPLIKASYNELIYNYELLANKNLTPVEFELQLFQVYNSELDLLETIYKINKLSYSNEKQKLINKLIIDIKNLSQEEKNNFVNKLEQLNTLMT